MTQHNEPRASRAPGTSQTSKLDEFFVGYLPTPAGHRRAMKVAVVILVGLVVAVGGLVALEQRSPGGGVWRTAELGIYEGVVEVSPYALLRTKGPDGAPGTLILVSEGKFGATARLTPFDGQAVRIRGTLLERDGRRMVEISSAVDGVSPMVLSPDEQRSLSVPPSNGQRRVTLRGEFIDPKCYIGAMKPGGGKTHKACAQLCVSGGIPPMFVTRTEALVEDYYLVVDIDGESAVDEVLPYLGDSVEVSGVVEMRGDLRVFRIDAKTVLRI